MTLYLLVLALMLQTGALSVVCSVPHFFGGGGGFCSFALFFGDFAV